MSIEKNVVSARSCNLLPILKNQTPLRPSTLKGSGNYDLVSEKKDLFFIRLVNLMGHLGENFFQICEHLIVVIVL